MVARQEWVAVAVSGMRAVYPKARLPEAPNRSETNARQTFALTITRVLREPNHPLCERLAPTSEVTWTHRGRGGAVDSWRLQCLEGRLRIYSSHSEGIWLRSHEAMKPVRALGRRRRY